MAKKITIQVKISRSNYHDTCISKGAKAYDRLAKARAEQIQKDLEAEEIQKAANSMPLEAFCIWYQSRKEEIVMEDIATQIGIDWEDCLEESSIPDPNNKSWVD